MDDITEDVIPVNITDELKSSYMDYAMSVIVGRALPDARDGLKPVHRRTLFAMFKLNNEWNRPHLKSARIVGEVMGKYHPPWRFSYLPNGGENGTRIQSALSLS